MRYVAECIFVFIPKIIPVMLCTSKWHLRVYISKEIGHENSSGGIRQLLTNLLNRHVLSSADWLITVVFVQKNMQLIAADHHVTKDRRSLFNAALRHVLPCEPPAGWLTDWWTLVHVRWHAVVFARFYWLSWLVAGVVRIRWVDINSCVCNQKRLHALYWNKQ